MSISGQWSGGTPSPQEQQPSYVKDEQTAATEILKLMQGLALVKDTLDISFSQLGGQIGRYPSNPARPTLPPLVTTRGATGFGNDTNDSWKQALGELVNMLPDGIKQEYLSQMSLPLSQRDLNTIVLDNVLTVTAMTITWAQGTAGPSATEGINEIDRNLSMALPYLALEGMIGLAGTTLAQSTAFLDAAGANYPQQDVLRNFVRLASKGLDEMTNLQTQMMDSQTTPTDQFALLSNKLADVEAQFTALYPGSDLSMLGVTLASMAALAAALSLAGTGNPTLFTALTIASIGVDTAGSNTGVIGPTLFAASGAIGTGLTQLLMPDATLAQQQMLNMTVAATFLGAIAISTLINDIGIGYMPPQTQEQVDEARQQQDEMAADRKEQANIDDARRLTFESALLIASHSGVIDATFSALVETFGLGPVQQQYMVESLKLLALTTAVLAAAPNGNPADAASLFDSLQGTYSKSLASLTNLVNEGVLNQTIPGDTASSLGVSLQQAQIALDSGNMNDFVTALMGPLELLGSNSDQFMSDLSTAKDFIAQISQALTSGMDDKTNTETRVNFVV